MEATPIGLSFPEIETPLVRPVPIVSIDTDFPEEEANRLAELESFNKHLFRPNTYLHKWWARRSGTTFRFILKQLVPGKLKRDYYSHGGLEGLIVLDPMMGGGTILHEAIRLGANVIGYDIDPIPVLQARASLSSIPLFEKEKVYRTFEGKLKEGLSPYFKTNCPTCATSCDIQFILYGLRKKSTKGEVVVVDSFMLREESDGTQKRLEELYPSRQVRLFGTIWNLIDKEEARTKGINGKNSDILSVPFHERYVPLVITGHCKTHESFFKALDLKDIDTLESARRWVTRNIHFSTDGFEIPSGPKSNDLQNRNVRHFYELFFPRQLMYINHCQSILRSLPKEHTLWMALLLSTSLEFNSALCGYKGAEKRRPGAIRHVFSHHAYSFPYTALENNPIFYRKASGTLGNLFESRVLSAGQWAGAPIERRYINGRWEKIAILNEVDRGKECSSTGEFAGNKRMFLVRQIDSSRMPLASGSVDFVVTDPPYFDSVQYSDLSHFFRCWLKTVLPNEANWDYLTESSAVAETTENDQKFGTTLTHIWQECNRVLTRPHGRLIFTYHHWNPSAWAQLAVALIKARFVLTNAFVVHSENPISVHIMNLRALKHDTILVLKPLPVQTERHWQKPEPISTSDSYSFCQVCGQMLGWVLDNDLPEQTILQAWSDFFKG